MTIGIYGFMKDSKIVYIGKSINIEKRIQRHFQELKNQKHSNIHFQRSFNKYGENAFSWTILESCEEKDLNEMEKHYIDSFEMLSKGYNQNPGGDGGARVFGVNSTHSKEDVLLIAEYLSKGLDSNLIAKKVFGSDDKVFLDYIGRIRRREIRTDLISDFDWDCRLNTRRTIDDQTVRKICSLIEKGLSNKEISLIVFKEWNKQKVNYLTKIRKRKIRKDISINYDW